ncbi:hypothetical protein [Hymenobacter armeniacus]|uniref:Uncharacterized protein n=1 Tax=Hymenobacter armeniacus TaxID=2771358 RepID=A0ABR8JTT9_9BACT|nr:hypothetical protein [Hymenobacter armeniacus]MBD2722176.1 hypothetical protein [Hymenobacter armeniacus]
MDFQTGGSGLSNSAELNPRGLRNAINERNHPGCFCSIIAAACTARANSSPCVRQPHSGLWPAAITATVFATKNAGTPSIKLTLTSDSGFYFNNTTPTPSADGPLAAIVWFVSFRRKFLLWERLTP